MRRIAGALRVDPGWFSTKPLNELQPDHPVQIKAHSKQGSDKNWDPNTQQQEHGFKVDLSYEHKFRQQLQDLMKLPHWTRVVSAGNTLSCIGYQILGMNNIRLSMKVPCARTPAHQENNNLRGISINIGPGDCVRCEVSEYYWGGLHELREKNSVNYLHGSWWPNMKNAMETVEKMKEVTVLASNIQVQLKEQDQKMVEQNSNDLNQIRIQIQDIENQNDISNQKITELDNGNQSLLKKLIGLEKSMGGSLHSKINSLQKDNDWSWTDYSKDIDKRLTDHRNNFDGEL